MSAEDLAKGLALLDDDDIRGRRRRRPVGVLADLVLTDEEAALLDAAADSEPEVVGHGISAGLGLPSLSEKVGPDPLTFDGATNPAIDLVAWNIHQAKKG